MCNNEYTFVKSSSLDPKRPRVVLPARASRASVPARSRSARTARAPPRTARLARVSRAIARDGA